MSAAAVLKLQKAGFTQEQVEALAEFAEANAATKTDLLETEARLERRIEAVERRIDTLESGLERRIDSVEGALGRRIDALDHKIDSLGMRLTIRLGWMIVGSSVAIIGAMAALFRLLLPIGKAAGGG